MSESDERVQRALEAHLEHLEFGGPAPDTSHLSEAERANLDDLIGLLEQTEGIAFGRSLDPQAGLSATTEAGTRLLDALRDALPAGARVSSDPAAPSIWNAGMRVAEGFLVGTFGGRIRIWLLEHSGVLTNGQEQIRGLDRLFRLLPDTAAIAIVEPDLSCLLVQPEDVAPSIEVPRGSLVPRRYRRPVQQVGEALSQFLSELVPSWEPVKGFGAPAISVEVGPIARARARDAIAAQVAAGGRARKTNPKRAALMGLGEREHDALADIAIGVHEARLGPQDIEHELRRLADLR